MFDIVVKMVSALKNKFNGDLFPAVPAPKSDAQALYNSVVKIKIGYEVLNRTRGRVGDSAVLVKELDFFADALVAELDKRYATAVEGAPTLGDIEDLVDQILEHINDGSIHGGGTTVINEGIGEAPVDGRQYGRQSASWTWVSDKHDALTDVTPDQHHNQVHLLFGPDHSDVDTTVPIEAEQGLFWSGDFKPDYRSYFIAQYVDGATYYPQQWATNQSYISIANKVTTEYAFPIEVGQPSFTYPEFPPFLTAAHVGQVRSGQRYTFGVNGEVRELRVWVPVITLTTQYSFIIVGDPDGAAPSAERQVLNTATLVAGEWNLLETGSRLILAGSVYDIYLESHDYTATTQVTGGWGYDGVANNGAPALETWNHRSANDVIRISDLDDTTTGRNADLMTIVNGSTIRFVDQGNTGNFYEYITTGPPLSTGGAVDYAVSLISKGGNISVGSPTTMTATIPVAAPTDFVYETDKWLNDNPSWANIESLLEYDGVPQPVGTAVGYGIDLEFHQLEKSQDWDIIILGSGGGGGGGGLFTPTLFTGAGSTGYVPDPLSESGRVLSDSGAWVPVVSGGVPEAPNDGQQYGRQLQSWTPVVTSPGGGAVLISSITDPVIGEFVFNNIPQIYSRLYIKGNVETTFVGVADVVHSFLNGDTVIANYEFQEIFGTGTLNASVENGEEPRIGVVAGSIAKGVSPIEIKIEGYAGSGLKSLTATNTTYRGDNNIRVHYNSVYHKTMTAAITQITLRPTGFIVSGINMLGTLSLYGEV